MLRPFLSFQITFVICSILFEQMFLFVYIWALPEYFSRWDESRRCRNRRRKEEFFYPVGEETFEQSAKIDPK